MWNPSDFNSSPSSYISSNYSLNSGGESSSNLQISNEYDKLFSGDWFSSAYSCDSQVKSEMEFSSSSLPHSNSHSVGEGDDSVKTVGMSNGEVQFNGSRAVSETELEKFVESGEVISRGYGSSKDPKRLKLSCVPKILQETAKKQQAKGTGKKSQRLGPKITALQQLISPYGKTDTSSVLQETENRIRYLHDQIKILTAPYMGNAYHQQVFSDLSTNLHSRGLCLVPLSPALVELTSRLASDRSVPGKAVPFSRFYF